ncbi:glycerol 3-phosphate dehydrogenase (NAD(P)+) [Salsuginibacillus halophilus]|uniref:Glycerol-3-phosphate dehydrogenase [NAD(P)+] n=1 Tax=Salsuginibacillus halophilus TaxID=517424 RepID=A0A2P8HW76_9BACI|nr:NAD(P)H-dependent glycerol-3-phosphate dehydrogenase [Salsuginibacillus halophilus]PSL50483.1 glycerol 3-phosphate dehydrogenase (NAD(P)+) [Salsuginibacillus halophilus]
MPASVAVLGAGSWGTALAVVLCDNGHKVKLWARREEQVQEINEQKTNEAYLPGRRLPDQLEATSSIQEAASTADAVVSVVPTSAVRETMQTLNGVVQHPVLLIHATKGIEPGSLKRVSEMMEEELEERTVRGIAVLSGPSHAEEVSERQPTTVTVSSAELKHQEEAQDLFMTQHFRVYTNPDVIGVELGGALKNIIALGIGMTDGLDYGDNAKAALMTRGLAEITRLGSRLGADPLTFSGLSGLGDLIVTCTSEHSRNFRCGRMLGEGWSLDDVLEQMGMVVEGVKTTKAVQSLAASYDVEMPITDALYEVLFNGLDPKEASERLMGRVKKREVEDLGPSNSTQ